MMPGLEQAVVPREKVEGYLLSFTHRTGRSKAEFFSRFGFMAGSWEELARALVRHAAANEVAKTEDSAFGKRYIIEGPLDAPDGRSPLLRSVWFVEQGQTAPHFVTAYPVPRRTKS